jgi:mono/diheme cytochrome c family protein
MKRVRSSLAWVLRLGGPGIGFLLLVGCQQQMAVQPSYQPFDPSSFFADGRSARPLVPNTIARGHLRTDRHLFTGKRRPDGRDWTQPVALVGAIPALVPVTLGAMLVALTTAATENANDVATFPFPVTRAVLENGRTRYLIYCAVCHDPVGTGRGKIVERGYTAPPSYHSERLRTAPVGHFYDVITHGYGSMPDYKEQVPVRDRWAIVAYIRALQLSQHFPEKDLTEAMRAEWNPDVQAHRAGGQPR